MPSIDPTIFGTYDIRGKYPEQINEDAVYRIARAFTQILRPRVTVVGRDMRTSSPSLTEAACRGVMDEGCDVIDIDLTTTPMYYYAVNALKADAGISITASHNPEQYNGLKLTGPQAVPAIELVSIEELRHVAERGRFTGYKRRGKLEKLPEPIDRYVRAVIDMAGLDNCGMLKLVIDTGNGMEGIVLPKLFENTNCQVIPLFWNPDGRFPNHEANPLKEETLTDLKEKLTETGANLGIAYDGDGDRVGFVDETGKRIPGDIITAILAKEMLKKKPGATIIYDVRSSWAVKEEIEKAGGKPLMWKVGHALIKKKMRETGAYFGGELSCHYYFADFHITDNGDLAMMTLIRTILSEDKPLSELARPIMRYFHSPEINSQVPDIPAKIKEVREHYNDGHIIELDGLTVEYDDWWFNLRPSQTEPLLRLNVEAKCKDRMEQKVRELLDIIRG